MPRTPMKHRSHPFESQASGATRRHAQRPWALVWVVTALVLFIGAATQQTVLSAGSTLHANESERLLVAFEDPSEILLERLHADPQVDVRWVESGLVLIEIDPIHRSRWRGREVARRNATQSLAVLRHGDRQRLKATDPEERDALAFVAEKTVGMARAAAGDVTLLVSSPGSWPDALLGCHGGLVLAPHDIDPRTLIDRGPPRELLPWVMAGPRPWSQGQRHVLQSVSTESLQVAWDELRLDPSMLPADRWAFSPELANTYIPRVQSRMQRALQGIAGASVTLQPFTMERDAPGSPPPPDSVVTITTHNVIARIPGSVPGTGTFVVGGHLDATGSRSSFWRDAVEAGVSIETPGAEDNASGVACVLEILRNIADGVRADSIGFAFDLEFIAFSGEEVGGNESGLKGSMHYVDERLNAGEKLLGIFNLDMVGSDSLGNNLQIAYNRASTWMIDFITEAMNQVTPPLDLTLTPELNEALASDHNSFWIAGSDGVLGSDASTDILRRYASYHRPTDTGGDVSIDKMGEVSRAFLAALLRFDTQANPQPEVVFPPEKLRLLVDVLGSEFTYVPGFHQLNPGDDILKAEMSFYNLGAVYADSLQVQLETQVGTVHTVVYDSLSVASLPTGGRVDVRLDPVPLEYGGAHTLVARVRSKDPGGLWTTQVSSIDYVVNGAGPPGQSAKPVLKPNPVARLDQTLVVADTSEDGSLSLRVYNLEGELVSQRQGTFTPAQMAAGVEVLEPSQARPNVVSGTYFVDVRWTGLSGNTFAEVLPAVVIQ